MIKDKRLPNLYLLPAAQTRDKNAVSVDQMKEAVQDARKNAIMLSWIAQLELNKVFATLLPVRTGH